MSFAQGRYGIMYHPTRNPRPRPKSSGRWVAVVLILVLIAFCTYRIVKKVQTPTPPDKKDPPLARVVEPPKTPIEKVVLPSEKTTPKTKPQPTPDAPRKATTADVAPSKKGEVLGFKDPTVVIGRPKPLRDTPPASPLPTWLEKALLTADADRPLLERQQMQRLAQAERDGNSAIAVDAIEKIYARPAMVDLQNHLVLRLGQLNMKRLLSETNTPWTTIVKIQRGDTLERLSREHRTTMAATQLLNPKLDPNRLKIGMPIRLLNYPNAVLVIHKKLESADLFLKGNKLFKRYYLRVGDKATPGSYPISNESGMTTVSRFSQFGLKPVQVSDRKELELFLAPGSRITVSDQ